MKKENSKILKVFIVLIAVGGIAAGAVFLYPYTREYAENKSLTSLRVFEYDGKSVRATLQSKMDGGMLKYKLTIFDYGTLIPSNNEFRVEFKDADNFQITSFDIPGAWMRAKPDMKDLHPSGGPVYYLEDEEGSILPKDYLEAQSFVLKSKAKE